MLRDDYLIELNKLSDILHHDWTMRELNRYRTMQRKAERDISHKNMQEYNPDD